ncbi:DNA-J related protein [Thiorhodovibrio winogradskyi]|uniref:DNA-J related protein n=1 Tax=Thiorhodovibrio winogradskyi TaxID=77007 RepID=A0ABZ0SGG8_9GAMM|nr:DNA-J related domain-containing protein [Thiorhodovibrio winogradskyi]
MNESVVPFELGSFEIKCEEKQLSACQKSIDQQKADQKSAGLADETLTLLLDILKNHPDGISEYDLLRALEQRNHAACASAPSRSEPGHPGLFCSELALFQAHFLLFNALYRLRDRLAAVGSAWLEIDVLCIVLRPDGFGNGFAGSCQPRALARRDPLRAYYLDIHQLTITDAQQVVDWLGDFWMRYFALESRAAALAVLGLVDPVDAQVVRRRYRELAMRLHPDRGGDADSFSRLISAKQVLERSAGYNASKRT